MDFVYLVCKDLCLSLSPIIYKLCDLEQMLLFPNLDFFIWKLGKSYHVQSDTECLHRCQIRLHTFTWICISEALCLCWLFLEVIFLSRLYIQSFAHLSCLIFGFVVEDMENLIFSLYHSSVIQTNKQKHLWPEVPNDSRARGSSLVSVVHQWYNLGLV